MKAHIRTTVLDIIDKNADILDTDGLYPFCNRVIIDSLNECSMDIFLTLSTFLTKLYDDEVDDIVDDLFESGFRKWSGLDEFNKFVAGITSNCWKDASYLDVGAMFRSYINNPAITEQIPPALFDIDIPSILKREDYYAFNILSQYTYSRQDYYPRKFDKPFIYCIKDITEVLDSFYIGVRTTSKKYPTSSGHYYVNLSNWESEYWDDSARVYYDTIKNVEARYFKKKGVHLTCDVCTALPKEIVDKYGLPIYEGK